MDDKAFIYMAPLEGLTGLEFRNVFARHFDGIDAAIDPFVSLNHPDINEKIKKWDIPKIEKQGLKTIPQFMGRNLKDFFHLVDWVSYMGYDEINWNLGCPVKKIVNKGRGCGQLKFPDEIRSFLDETVPKIRIKFSIKTRLGLEDPDEIFKLMELYNDYDLSEIILHPRIGKQLYSGSVYLDYFEECLRISKNKLVYNGDIKSVNDYNLIKEKFPSVEKIMIGRGLIQDPFLAEKIKGNFDPNAPFPKDRFEDFFNELFVTFETKFWNMQELLGKMKEYWLSFSYLFENRDEVSKYIVRSQSLDEFHKRVTEILS